MPDDIRELVKELGEPYSALLGIDLGKGDPEYVKWFLAAYLYAKPIQEEAATDTYKTLVSHGYDNAARIANADRYRLVELLDEGGYARYDESTADRLIAIFGKLERDYGGSLSRLYAESGDSHDLEERMRALGKGIGPVTVSVFLRDMRKVWPKADPQPTPRVVQSAKSLGIGDIGKYAREHKIDRIRLETALHRYSRKIMKGHCISKNR